MTFKNYIQLLKFTILGSIFIFQTEQCVGQYVVNFENDGETKSSYTTGIVQLSGIDWELNNVLIGTTTNDYKNGQRAARLRAYDGAYMTMLADKLFGVENVTFVYRQYGTDTDQQTWAIEYSVNQGESWESIGEIIPDANVRVFTANLHMDRLIRFRIRLTTSPGETGNRRFNIDDIIISDYRCESDSYSSIVTCPPYLFFGEELTETGHYEHILPLANSEDCDSIVNLDLVIVDGFTYYADNDGDGLGNLEVSIIACEQPDGYIDNALDCDDTDESIGEATTIYYQDYDGDGFGNPDVTVTACEQPDGYVTDNTDCDDLNETIYPGAIEIPEDGIDQNCDGEDATLLGNLLGIYQFNGTEGCSIQDVQATTSSNTAIFTDYTSVNTNCAIGNGIFNRSGWNTSSDVNTSQYNEFTVSAAECSSLTLKGLTFVHRTSTTGGNPIWRLRCNLDNFVTDIASGQSFSTDEVVTVYFLSPFENIDGVSFRLYITDIAASSSTWRNDDVAIYGHTSAVPEQLFYADMDGDGYGDNLNTILACSLPENYVENNLDCDDQNVDIHPETIWYEDLDDDGFGNTYITIQQCEQPLGYVLLSGDCNDLDPTIHPDAIELCNGIDDNCNDEIDEGLEYSWYYGDLDGDGYGFGSGIELCAHPGEGYVTNNLDCDDTDPLITLPTVYYADNDGDGFGAGEPILSCDALGEGFVTNNDDCDDTDNTIYPGAPEIPNDGIDQDCSGYDLITTGTDFIALLDFEVVPNPSDGRFTVVLPYALSNTRIIIYALTGELISTSSFTGTSLEMDLRHIATGMYFVQLTHENGNAVQRIVKE
jgi:hypothetical protein